MKVKATVSFAGALTMAAGEVRDVPKSVATPLLKCGYLVTVSKKETEPDTSTEVADNGTEPDSAAAGPGVGGADPDSETED